MSKKGTTWEDFREGDLTYLFRKQEKRSLGKVDLLIQRQQYIRKHLGDSIANSIEKDPDLFYNHERFRIWHAQARFRAILTTLVVAPTIFTAANGFRDGAGWARKNRYLSTGIIFGTFVASYYVHHRAVGYNNQACLEQTYAKNHKMLRNKIIKQ